MLTVVDEMAQPVLHEALRFVSFEGQGWEPISDSRCFWHCPQSFVVQSDFVHFFKLKLSRSERTLLISVLIIKRAERSTSNSDANTHWAEKPAQHPSSFPSFSLKERLVKNVILPPTETTQHIYISASTEEVKDRKNHCRWEIGAHTCLKNPIWARKSLVNDKLSFRAIDLKCSAAEPTFCSRSVLGMRG